MTFTETIYPQDNLKLVVSLLLPVHMCQEHIWKDWLSGEEKFAFISEPFLAVEIYLNNKYQGLLTKNQIDTHLNLDITKQKYSVINKAKDYLKSRTSNDSYNQMMYNNHISSLEK